MRRFLLPALTLIVANALIFVGGAPILAAPVLASLGAFLLAILLPGWGAVSIIAGAPRTRDQWLESLLYGIGAGFALCALATLLLAYLPGAIERWQLLLAFNSLALLSVVALFMPHQSSESPSDATTNLPRSFWIAAALLLLLAASLRTVWLGYSEFQGDEARVMLRAQELLAGFENPIFVHHKMPGEILFTTAIYGLSGVTSEAAVRLPFALASLTAVVAVLLLGWRLFGPAAGIVAAALFAVDGFAVAFGRIVQYQSVVILASALIILLFHDRLSRDDSVPLWRWLFVPSIVAVGALYAHYDILAIGLPVLWLLWKLAERRGWRRVAVAVVPALLVALLATAVFLLPWVNNPGFGMAFRYVLGERVGTTPPYNNFLDFAHRAFTYAGSYYVITLAIFTLVGAALLFMRAFGRIWGGVLSLLLALATIVAFALGDDWGATASVAPFALLLLSIPLLPKLSVAERTVWLWFSPLVVASLFLISSPDSHVYIFFLPWVLLVGGVCQEAWEWAGRSSSVARTSFAVAGVAALCVFWLWPWLVFADAPSQRFRQWETAQPVGYWYPFDAITERANMGFPLRTGWRSLGALMVRGAMAGGFETNAKPEVVDWYTRGYGSCPAPVVNYFATPSIEQDAADFADLIHAREANSLVNGSIWVMDNMDGVEGIRLFSTDRASLAGNTIFESVYASEFAKLTGQPPRAARGRVAEFPFHSAVNARLGDAVHLLGVTGGMDKVRPGDSLHYSLMWTTNDILFDSWTVFLQLVDPATNAKAGQTDALPVCGTNPTTNWRPGDLIVDPQQIAIFDDAAPGAYTLFAGMYNVITGERLPVTLADGTSSGDWISLGQVIVE